MSRPEGRSARPGARPPRTGERHLWRSVPNRLSQVTRTKAVVAVVVVAVIAALAATGIGYAAMGKTVTLSIDGRTQKVHTFGDHVADVLADRDITLGDHDVVAPSPGSGITDGQTIAVEPIEVERSETLAEDLAVKEF